MKTKTMAQVPEKVSDDKNPKYLFNSIDSDLVLGVASGRIDAKAIAAEQMASRGLGLGGQWVGFEAARKVWGVR